ncbi:MAG: hypothetical protein MHM6MM_003740 [Cercozoa sp. M6MM]
MPTVPRRSTRSTRTRDEEMAKQVSASQSVATRRSKRSTAWKPPSVLSSEHADEVRPRKPRRRKKVAVTPPPPPPPTVSSIEVSSATPASSESIPPPVIHTDDNNSSSSSSSSSSSNNNNNNNNDNNNKTNNNNNNNNNNNDNDTAEVQHLEMPPATSTSSVPEEEHVAEALEQQEVPVSMSDTSNPSIEPTHSFPVSSQATEGPRTKRPREQDPEHALRESPRRKRVRPLHQVVHQPAGSFLGELDPIDVAQVLRTSRQVQHVLRTASVALRTAHLPLSSSTLQQSHTCDNNDEDPRIANARLSVAAARDFLQSLRAAEAISVRRVETQLSSRLDRLPSLLDEIDREEALDNAATAHLPLHLFARRGFADFELAELEAPLLSLEQQLRERAQRVAECRAALQQWRSAMLRAQSPHR